MFGMLKKQPEKLVYAVIPAAGTSSRMGGSNKLLLQLGGMPVLCRTLRVFEACEQIDGIVLACREQDVEEYRMLTAQWGISKIKGIVVGGETREHSVLQGVLACPKSVGYVAIHDAARPLVTEEIISQTVEMAKRDSAAAPAVPVKDSIQRVKKGKLVENIERKTIVAVQTPQCFDIDLIRAALTDALRKNLPLTDDCGAALVLGQPSTMTEGSYENIKITTPEDILLGETILKGREQA